MDMTQPTVDLDFFLTLVLRSLLYRIPVIIVCVVGMVLALVRRSRQPGVSLLALLGCGLLLAVSLAGPVWQAYVTMHLMERELSDSPGQFRRMMAVVEVGFVLLQTAGLGLVVAAVFAGRRPLLPPRTAEPAVPRATDETVQLEMPGPATDERSEQVRRADDRYRT